MENEIKVFTGFDLYPDRKTVFRLIDCAEDSPVYEEALDIYDELLPVMRKAVQPRAALRFGLAPKITAAADNRALRGGRILPEGTKVLYGIHTIGEEAPKIASAAFAEGDYLKGMIADAMADGFLFALDEPMRKIAAEEAKKLGYGISRRCVAPTEIPMIYQKTAYDALSAHESIGVTLTSGLMFSPVKSCCMLYLLSEDISESHPEKNCDLCAKKDCPMRNAARRNCVPDAFSLKVRIFAGKEALSPGGSGTAAAQKEEILQRPAGETVMETLRKNGYFIPAVCGGRGGCGKCGVRFLEGAPEILDADRKAFTAFQLTEGWRLSCLAVPEGDAAVLLTEDKKEDTFEIIGAETSKAGAPEAGAARKDAGFDIAVDIGTTTLVLALVGTDGAVIDTYSTINRQRSFGADVISRMQASNEGNGPALRRSIQEDLLAGIKALLDRNELKQENINRVAIAGNTTMGHLLLGFSCRTLGVVPFTPVDISLMKLSFSEVFGSDLLAAEVIMLPGVTTYVGADITAGMYAYDIAASERISFLIDLGTNGEMALGNKDKLLVTSTAAGPAFEGGNITWGCGSIRGAICAAEIKNEKAQVKTIGDGAPVGICGTGVVEITDALLREELLDETGVLDDDYFDDGFPVAETAGGETIVFTQKDVREVQLAKAAVRAGLETLLLRYGITYDDVAHVYLAGGFGYRMDKKKAVGIGLLPAALEDRIETVGNSSLRGAIRYLADPEGDEAVTGIAANAEEVSLSADKAFNEFYMDAMMFDEES